VGAEGVRADRAAPSGRNQSGGTGITDLRYLARRGACALAVIAAIASIVGSSSAAAADFSTDDCRALPTNTCLGDPFDVTAPVGGLATGGLGSTGSPEDDLQQILEDLGAIDPGADGAIIEATTLRGRALAILEGDARRLITPDDAGFLDRKAYAGIPLLNIEPKVQNVPAGTTTVDVREVRFGDHALLDTSMLRFADMDSEFTINWHVTELGTSFGGALEPAGVPAAGPAHRAVLDPLVVPNMIMGTKQANRFHPDGGEEQTRLVTQVVPVAMPAPRELVGGGILDPNLRPGHETFAQIAVGPANGPNAIAPTVVPNAGKVAPDSPIAQIHTALDDLDPDDPAFVTEAKAVGAGDAALVGAMRSRDTLPEPSTASPSADVNVQFANAEAYVSKRELRVAPDTSPDGTVTLAVRNLDEIDHDFSVRELRNRSTVGAPGVLSWGAFDTSVLPGDTVTVPAGTTKTVTVTPDPTAFTLWLGDPRGGDQAAMAIALDRGPRQQSLGLGLGPVKPLHEALDRTGSMWVTLANSDEIARLRPTSGALSSPDPELYPLPGGVVADPPQGTAAVGPVLGPGDVQVDGHGIVWVTLGAANAIARIDPTKATPGTTDGMTVYPLKACTDVTCRTAPVPGPAAAPLSRVPLQMRVWEDGGGNTAIAFTEQNADAIGLLRVDELGKKLNEQHINCGCLQPLGIALDPSGDIWFSEGSSNRLGRMTLDQADPFSAIPHHISHYNIPSPVCEAVPGQTPNGDPNCQGAPSILPPLVLPNPALTTLPHSVAVDRKGRVWYSGEASETVGYLDPTKAHENTQDGFHDTPGPKNEFGRALAPADIAIDADGTAFFSDEYGDQIASATIDDAGDVHAQFRFRPTGRNSLTDSPLVDPAGNLWFVEAGANLMTRVSNVAAGVPLPSRSPLLIANTSTGRLTGSGLPVDISSIDVHVVRGGKVVARADAVPVRGQSFAVTLPFAGDDKLELVPNGPHPPAPFSVRVANLTARVAANGAVVGSARNDGAPLAEEVAISAGGTSGSAHISIEDGGFSWSGGLNPATASGTVSWTGGNVSARFRTVTPFVGAGDAGTTPAAPAPPLAGLVPVTSQTPAPSGAKPAACATSRWLSRTGTGRRARRTLPLLGLGDADVERCLGTPAKRSSARWTYRGRVPLEVRFVRGRVTGFTLRGPGMASAPDRAAVGSSLRSFRRALGTLARDGGRGYRAVLRVGADHVADVRLATDAARDVSRVSVSLRPRSGLDRAGRRMAGSAR
jgi:streptogramin lyase